MNNFMIDLTAEGRESLRDALRIAYSHNAPGSAALSYSVRTLGEPKHSDYPANLTDKKGLIFRWHTASGEKDVIDLPFRLDIDGATDFAFRWLAEQDYGPQPGHDGSNKKGWRMFVGVWGHVAGDSYAICAIFPEWAWYGK